MSTKTTKPRTKKEAKKKVTYAPYVDNEMLYGSSGKLIGSPYLPEEDKIPDPIGYIPPSVEEEVLERGEKGHCKRVANLQKFLERHKIAYDIKDGDCFIVTVKKYIADIKMRKIDKLYNEYPLMFTVIDEYYCLVTLGYEDIDYGTTTKELHNNLLEGDIFNHLKRRHGKL